MSVCQGDTDFRTCRGAAAALAALLVFVPATARGAEPIVLHDVTAEAGVRFEHTDGSSGRMYVVETVTAGLALFDYDGDGDEDIYFVNGAPLTGTVVDQAPRNKLYRNDGNWRFTDVTSESKLGDTGYGMGVVAGDYDNDGDLDLYLSNYGPNVMYRNNGDGTFTDVTAETGTANGDLMGAGVVFLDMDSDGDLDLYASSYLLATDENHVEVLVDGVAIHPGPRQYPPAPDTLYRNNGNGTFTDVSAASGLADLVSSGMGVVAADFDHDGDTDIFVCNDRAANYLLQNDGRGRFTEVGLMAGVAYDHFAAEEGSMGVTCADYNNDGLLDLFVTSYQGETTTLYENRGDGLFDDVTRRTGAGTGTYPLVTWGNAVADFDHDGDRDIFMVGGHMGAGIARFDDRADYEQSPVLLRNDGSGRFEDVSAEGGAALQVRRASRGAAFDDLDDDGDLDVVILNTRSAATVLRNDTVSQGHWLRVRLRGVKTNGYGVGARVTLTAGDLTLVDEVHAGSGYQSHYGLTLHFGLGPRQRVDRIEVRWLGGGVEVFEGVEVDRVVTLTEGAGKAR